MAFNYKREESSNLGAGDYRFEVIGAEEQVSKSGKDMIVITLRPNGVTFFVKDYIVDGEWFNKKMTSFFDSTGIEDGNFNFPTWVGAVGAARFKEDENGYLKVGYYMDKKRAEKLPPWQGEMPERQTVTEIGGMVDITDDSDLPF